METVGHICQVAYPVLWLTGSWLVTNRRRRLGLWLVAASLPFSIVSYGVVTRLWGSLALELVAAVIYGRALWLAHGRDREGWR